MQVGDGFLLDCECLSLGYQSSLGHVLLHRQSISRLKTYEQISDCLESARAALQREEMHLSDRERFAWSILELLENAYRHGVYRSRISDAYPFLFELFSLQSGVLCARVSNLVDASVCERLDARLCELATMPKSQIVEHYRTRMRLGRISVVGGAGAGLLGIARYALRITHQFESVDERTSYFSIQVYYQPQFA